MASTRGIGERGRDTLQQIGLKKPDTSTGWKMNNTAVKKYSAKRTLQVLFLSTVDFYFMERLGRTWRLNLKKRFIVYEEGIYCHDGGNCIFSDNGLG